MNKKFARLNLSVPLALALALATVFVVLAAPGGPSGNGIQPVEHTENLTCQDLAPAGETWFELKYEPVEDGSDSDGVLSVDVEVYDTANGPAFDWTSNIGVDAVFVKGGNGGNLYQYDPPLEATEDTGLHAPINPQNNKYFGLSHISFCYDIELQVTKDADTTFTRTYEWDIEKTVAPETLDMFSGDTGAVEYTVTVTKTGFTDSDWAVTGNIEIFNPHPSQSATITSVTDEVSMGIAADVDCGVTFPYALAAGATLECSYSADLPDGANRTNTATVTTSGSIDGGLGTADVTFGDPTTEVNATITVDDTFAGDLGAFSDSGSTSYNRTFACNGDAGEHNNTATINETGQSDDAKVTVNCYELAVEKDVNTALTRTWTWTIDKDADQTELLLSEGQLFQVNYEVTVDATSEDSGWAVSGTITVENPAPIDATLNSVADVVSPNIAADVDCGVTFPYTLTAGNTLNCSYSADLPDDEDRTNTATATLQNYDYDSEGTATPSGTTDFSFSADVSFANATVNEVDECVDVNDTNVGFLGTVCAGDAPKTFEYSLWFGAHPDADVVLECGENTHVNVADFVTNDTGTTGDDDHTVNATVECFLGCTLTQGYWKTHSDRGPAPYDDAWNNLGALEEDTPFFLSGQTWYEVFWTPSAGNPYYNLAHQYMAAKLNVLNGASAPAEVQAALTQAESLFNTYTPSQVAAFRGNNATRKQFVDLATILDKYNNGLIGPGHCSE
ncbi:MAG: hypothetical protein M3Y68_02850 [Chloroflexota bacterium]|nr:hypothetical protein [Chloroflexota bacterium]